MSEPDEPMTSRGAPSPVITVAAVVIRHANGRLLTVRKKGAVRFMLPGGKPEPGEDRRRTALRESLEELSVELRPDDLVELGVFRADAANEVGHLVEAHGVRASVRARRRACRRDRRTSVDRHRVDGYPAGAAARRPHHPVVAGSALTSPSASAATTGSGHRGLMLSPDDTPRTRRMSQG